MSTDPTLAELLDLERIDADYFRANVTFDEQWNLYGGQVLAQALVAGGRTVEEGRRPHSIHGYFLRAGRSEKPTIFQVFRDRDGRSFSARRVIAIQEGEVILNASMSFQVPDDTSHVEQVPTLPEGVPAPGTTELFDVPRCFNFEGARVPQPYDYADGSLTPAGHDWTTRFWTRCTDPEIAKDPLLDAAAVLYVSDIFTGTFPFASPDKGMPGPSLDHVMWFHHSGVSADWMLVDFQPIKVVGGRGLYTGQFFDATGRLINTMAQENLFRQWKPRG